MLRKLQATDVPQVARIHKNALPEDFLPSLGEEFLEILHRSAVDEQETWTFVFVEGSIVKGFVMGTVNFKNLFLKTLRYNGLNFALIIFKRIMRNPSILLKALETLLYPLKEKSSVEAELVVIAVESGTQGKGVGGRLVKRLEQEFRKRKVQEYKVTTLKKYKAAINFYKKLGFKLAREFSLYGKAWNLYVKRF